MSKESKFDIFEIIRRISNKEIEFFDNLKDYEIRQIYPLVLMKWIAGAKNAQQVKFTNELVNTLVFALHKHPKLLYKLLMISSTSKDRVQWIKRPKKETETETIKVIKEYYDCSTREAKDYLTLLSKDDILEMSEMLGIEKENLAKLKKELNG